GTEDAGSTRWAYWAAPPLPVVVPVTPIVAEVMNPVGWEVPVPVTRSEPNLFPIARPACIDRYPSRSTPESSRSSRATWRRMPYLNDDRVASAIGGSHDGNVAACAAVKPDDVEWAVVFGICSVSPPPGFSTAGPACLTPH